MRWLVQNENKSLSIVFAKKPPPNSLCEARPEWDSKTLSYDEKSNLVFIDPNKVRTQREADARVKAQLEIKQRKDMLLRLSNYAVYIIIAFALGFFLGHLR
jgi:hypothetical protein